MFIITCEREAYSKLTALADAITANLHTAIME